ncbi:hypothetical protein ACFQJ5_07265 [Halomicroarcula sp. GCM10025324]|uniref:DUF7263 family protein n=1 Tax=Haloarcula TaxID=2237 RepID=UPI0023E88F16|nr:hypothetical protein [Halomicroarcula sp. ZS-22-S1]
MSAGVRRPPVVRRVRGQTTLPALALALVVLTVVTGLSLGMADAAITGADRSPDERRAAVGLAAHLVAPDGPLAVRENVLGKGRVDSFDGDDLNRVAPPTDDYALRVRLGGRTIARRGTLDGGTTARRIVLVERRVRETVTADLRDTPELTLPRRTGEATVTLTPPNGTTVWTVRATDRVVLHNKSGLEGRFELSLVPYETTTLRVRFAGPLDRGDVTVAYDAPRTTKATLAVTVDA